MVSCLARSGLAQEQPKQRTAPVVNAVYVDAPPVIDGGLDDPCWTRASRLEGFFVPSTNEAVPEETFGLICVDDKAIYVAVICKDRTPADIKATETRRNGHIWQDDVAEFGLDPWHKHDEMYSFRVTARGTQMEEIPGGSATKIEWRGDWTAAASRTADGWQAEMAIPFSILRYPPGQTTFGFTIGRHLAEESIWVSYPVMGKDWDSNLTADLVGLNPPPYHPRPIFMPYVTVDAGDFVGRRFDTGLDVQYRMINGLTGLAALNPDFKQIEDVVEPISFSYTERYLEDQRPFFVTGQGYLPGDVMLYTRRIEDFDAGVKLFGTLDDETIGLMDAITYGVENSLAGEWGHKFNPDLNASLRFVSHRKEGEPNSLVYAFRLSRSWRCEEGSDDIRATFRQSQTQDGPGGACWEVGGGHWRGEGELNYDWEFQTATKNFDPPLGYFYDHNALGGRVGIGKWEHYEKGALSSQGWNLDTEYYPYLDGSGMLRTRLSPQRFWEWRNGRSLWLGFSRALEYDQDSSDAAISLGWNGKDLYHQGGLFVLKGVRASGDYGYLSFSQGFRPLKDCSVNLNTEYSRLQPPAEDAGHSCQTVLTTAYDLTSEKCIAARAIWRDGAFSAYASYRQVVRRGMDAYVIVGDPDPDRTGFATRLAFKLIWVF